MQATMLGSVRSTFYSFALTFFSLVPLLLFLPSFPSRWTHRLLFYLMSYTNYYFVWWAIQLLLFIFLITLSNICWGGAYLNWLLCPFDVFHLSFFFFLNRTPYFLTLQEISVWFYAFPALTLESAISPRSPDSILLENDVHKVVSGG